MIKKTTNSIQLFVLLMLFFLASNLHSLAQCSVFADDFESGILQPIWTAGTNIHSTNISSTASPQGIYHLEYTNTVNGVYNQGRKASFTPSAISQCSWKMKSTTFAGTPTGNVVIGDANLATNFGIIQCFFFNSSITFLGSGSMSYNHPAVANTWYTIEIKNINWTTKTYDIYVNNTLAQLGFPFRNLASTNVSQFSLYNFGPGTVSYDDIKLDTATGGLTFSNCLAFLNANSCGPINYTPPTATNDCIPVTPILVNGLGSGAVFPIGTTVEEYKIYDTTVNIHFYENFANNNAGWTLGTEWQIGSATVSTGHVAGGPDPGTDNTPTADNGVAGVIIGGNATTSVHPTYYITSPTINTASVTGKLELEYYRWLNSDFTPYMQNFIEVYDGSSWQVIWQTGGFPNVTDNVWTPQSFDITPYKNASMQVRFGHNVGAVLSQLSSSWNIDDIIIKETSIDSATCQFNVIVTDNTPPVADIATLPTLDLCIGDTIQNIPSATDECAGLISGATSTPLVQTTPGTFTITWNYNDGNGNISSQTQNLIVHNNPVITALPDSVTVCTNQSVTLSATGGQTYSWTGGVTNNVPFVPTASSSYIVTGSDAFGCMAKDTSYIALNTTVASSPTASGASPASICAGNYSSLIANTFSPLDTIYWYTQPVGGAPFATTTSGGTVLVNPSTSIIYYAEIKVNSSSKTFNYTGAIDSFIVPAGVTSLDFIVEGAQGNFNTQGVPGGLGGRSVGSRNVTPGQKLYINVGGGGQIDTLGGYNGGGNGGSSGGSLCDTTYAGGGGGASDIRFGGKLLFFREIVAGGGGGAGGNRNTVCGRGNGGGGGGGYYGGGGGAAWPFTSTVLPTGGSQSAGGIGGISDFTVPPNNDGMPGTLGNGGNGGHEVLALQGANGIAFSGGAGGGNMGGDGQHNNTLPNIWTGQSGAGGSGFVSSSILNAVTTSGVRSGPGRVIINWNAPCPSYRVSVPVSVTPPSTIISNATANNVSSVAGTSSGTQIVQTIGSNARSIYNGSCEIITTVTNNSAPLGNTVAQVTVTSAVPTHNTQPYVARWYQIVSDSSNVPAEVHLYFTQGDFDDYNAYASANSWPLLPSNPTDANGIANLRITKNGNAGLGNNPVVIIPSSILWNSVNSYWEITFNTPGFSQFRVHAVNPNNLALSVLYSNFNVQKLENADLIEWTTQTENNNSHFHVQRSADGIYFQNLGLVKSKAETGNSSTELDYSFIDKNPLSGINYYRLKQVDVDNHKSYSEIKKIVWHQSKHQILIYPNPSRDVINVELNAENEERIDVKIVDLTGRTIKSISQKSVRGKNTIQLSMNDLAEGIYGIQVYLNNKVQLVDKVRKK